MSDTASTTSTLSDSELGAAAPRESSQTNGQNTGQEIANSSAKGAGLDALLAKKRNEVMYEIRNLKLGERPVTSGESRQNIDSFLAKRIEATTKTEHDLPANVDDVEEHRPESVVVEVQGLFDRRPVSSLLQSLQFRRTLERAIRQGISSVPTPFASQQRFRRDATTPLRPRSDSNTSGSLSGSRGEIARAPSVSSHSSVSSRSSARGATAASPVQAQSTVPSAIPPPPPIPADGIPTVSQPWLQQAVNESLQHEPAPWQYEETVRENLVTEISELVHRQLVTQTLEGNFRAVLELRMQDHLSRTGTDGRNALETLQQLPRSDHVQRNDFSHLGIQAPGQENLDNISIVSASAVPYPQSNLALNREMQAMKAQLAELRNMMQLSFTMQMDIQRAIRQEVAAAMSQNGAQASAPGPQVQSKPASDSNCLICLDSHADAVLYQCGHLCTCYTCGLNLQSRGANCPVCRAPIKDIIRVYQCNAKRDQK